MSLHAKVAVVLALSAATTASAAEIPLEAGDYGEASLACDNEPNAAIISFDGRNFQYPHATHCTDTVTDRSSGILSISETCRANGDGSPSPPSTETLKIRVIGADRFATLYGKGSATYRRCGALGFFEKR